MVQLVQSKRVKRIQQHKHSSINSIMKRQYQSSRYVNPSLPLMEVEVGLIGNVSFRPLMVVVMDVACEEPRGLLTVMVFPFRPMKVCPSATVSAFMLTPGMTKLARVEAARDGVKRPVAWRTDVASLVRENTVEMAKGVAKKLERA